MTWDVPKISGRIDALSSARYASVRRIKVDIRFCNFFNECPQRVVLAENWCFVKKSSRFMADLITLLEWEIDTDGLLA